MVVFGQCCFIAQLIGPYHFFVFVEFLDHASVFIVAVRSARVIPFASFRIYVVIAEGRFEFQVFDKLVFSVKGIESAGYVFALEVVSSHQCRVTVANADQFAVPRIVFVVDRVGGNDGIARSIKRRGVGRAFGIHFLVHGCK